MASLEQRPNNWPDDPWSDVVLAGAHSHLFADRPHHVPFDPVEAAETLRQGLARLGELKGYPDQPKTAVLHQRTV